MHRNWLDIAQAPDPDDIREHILTGFRDGKPFTPYVPTLTLPPARRVLDFGCGLGRNFPYLRSVAAHVTGYDLPPMIDRCRTLAPSSADALSADWEAVRAQRFDLVFATLVLQHLDPAACRAALHDFADMAPAVYLLTRTESDSGERVLDIVAKSGRFVAGPCVRVEHDPETHQLRVTDRQTLDAARATPAGAHYEVVLTCLARPAGDA